MEWIKVMCNFNDHRKIKLILKEHRGDTLVLLWLSLVAEAGKCGRGGALLVCENTPYDAKTLSLLLAMFLLWRLYRQQAFAPAQALPAT